MTTAADLAAGQPLVFRNATVLTMDDGHRVLAGADVLITGERIAAVGPNLQVPDGTVEIDATGGIVMPGMIDTHRHMWQTAMRAYGADWTLTQYFVWYYLNWGNKFRPQDVYAGNLLSAIESIDAGVTTTVDWSHGLQTTDHAEAATDALEEVPGRFVLAYGNIQQGSWEWSTTPEFRDFYVRRFDGKGDMLGFAIAFDIPGDDPAFPEKATFEVAREMGVPVTTHAGVYGITVDAGVRKMYENGFCTPSTVYVHSASLSPDSYHMIAATGGSVSVSTESECSAGQGYPPTWKLRKYGIPVSLSQDTSVWWSGDIFSAMRATLSADRVMDHFEKHNEGKAVTNHHLRAEQVVDWATRGGAKAHRPGLGRRQRGGGQEGRPGADQERRLTGQLPDPAPLRPRGLPGSARRRAHRGGERAGGQVRPQAGRRGPGQGQAGDRRDRRVPAERTRRAGLGRGHEPRDPRARDPGQPVHLHRRGRLEGRGLTSTPP